MVWQKYLLKGALIVSGIFVGYNNYDFLRKFKGGLEEKALSIVHNEPKLEYIEELVGLKNEKSNKDRTSRPYRP